MRCSAGTLRAVLSLETVLVCELKGHKAQAEIVSHVMQILQTCHFPSLHIVTQCKKCIGDSVCIPVLTLKNEFICEKV